MLTRLFALFFVYFQQMAIVFALILVCFFSCVREAHSEFPYIFKHDLSQIRNNTGELCAAQMDVFVVALANFDTWALTMLDASSKIPSGILQGNIYDFGNFHQCIGVEHKVDDFIIKGKHCSTALYILLDSNISHANALPFPFNSPKKFRGNEEIELALYLSLCIPDACTPKEVFAYLNIKSALLNDEHCQIFEPTRLDALDIIVVTFFSIILFLMVASTVYDVYLYKTGRSSIHPILLAFSVFTNGRKLLTINTDDERQLSSLYGLRCISIMWVVFGHRYTLYISTPSVNLLDVVQWPTKLYSQYIQAAHLAVDTFFFMSGMMISYGYFNAKEKTKGLSFVPLYYVHRYLRLTPAVAVLFLVIITIWRYFGSGPIWLALTESSRGTCLNWWWSLFLYVQNYVNYDDVCVMAAWYLSADMQMFLLSPLILLPLEYIMIRSSRRIVYGICTSLVLLFMLIQAIIKLNVESNNETMTHERLGVWMVGFTAGVLLQEIKARNKPIKINRVMNLLIWTIVLVGMVSIILTMHDVEQNPERLKSNMFYTFHRPAWGLGLAWIVYSCTIGYGGIVNWILSITVFQVLSRLTYSMYLVHYYVIFFSVGQTNLQFYFSEYNVYYLFCGDIINTTIVAFIWVLAFESPVIVIEKCIFGPCAGWKKVKEKYAVKENIDPTVGKLTVADV